MEYRIKELLKNRGIKIEDFANKIGITRETLSRIINGAGTSSDTLERIANALSVSVPELFEQPASDVINCPHCGGAIKITKG